jgi:hypothetical protein
MHLASMQENELQFRLKAKLQQDQALASTSTCIWYHWCTVLVNARLSLATLPLCDMLQAADSGGCSHCAQLSRWSLAAPETAREATLDPLE